MVIEVPWTFDHVTCETRPTCSRTVKACLDDQFRSDHAGERDVLLGAKDVVDLLVDLLQVPAC
jgi:hypothetical protein